MLPPGCCSRFVWPTWSTSLLARAPIVVRSRGSQQKYCVALSEKSWCDSSVCDEYTLFVLSKWLGIHLTRAGHGPSSCLGSSVCANLSVAFREVTAATNIAVQRQNARHARLPAFAAIPIRQRISSCIVVHASWALAVALLRPY